jgi:hypothetical protein
MATDRTTTIAAPLPRLFYTKAFYFSYFAALGGILRGRPTMVGSGDLDERLAAAEAVFARIERGVRRLDEANVGST